MNNLLSYLITFLVFGVIGFLSANMRNILKEIKNSYKIKVR